MENVEAPKFSGSLKLSIAKNGSKGTKDTEPSITLTPTVNRFELNPLTSQLMELQTKDTVMILVNDEAKTINEKFFLAKGLGEASEIPQAVLASDDQIEGIGKKLSFNYSGVYSRILVGVVKGDLNAPEIALDKLRQLGLVKAEDSARTALWKIHAKVAKVEGENGIISIEGNDRQIYQMFDFVALPYSPRGEK